jgi:aminotransferase class I and II
MDFDALERQASRPEATLMLLCNPHNPAGRLWTRSELERVSDICTRHGVTIVSDEIHCELTAPGTGYVPMATINPDTVYCVSPSKAFNTAGLHIGNIICGDPEKRARIDRAVNINEVCDVNPFGIEGLKAAYTERGAEWLDACRDYLWGNYDLLRREFALHLPQCPVSLLEATYLVWVDVTALTDDAARLERSLVEEARVHVNGGDMYGDNRYIRINLACPRERLEEGLKRIFATLNA